YSVELTVVGENPDGSKRVFVRGRNRSVHERAAAPSTQPAEEEYNYSRFDVMPDGRVTPASDANRSNTPAMLPLLPIDEKALGSTWTRTVPLPGMDETYHSDGPPSGGAWGFTGSDENRIFKRIYGMTGGDDLPFRFVQRDDHR